MASRTRQAQPSADGAWLKRLNTSRVLQALYGSEPKSVTMLTHELVLSRPTVDNAIKELVGRGLVEKLDPQPQDNGRPPVMLGFCRAAGYLLGIDIGAHSVRAILTDLEGDTDLRADHDQATRCVPREHRSVIARDADRATRLAAIDQAISTVLDTAAVTPDQVWAVIVGTPGIVDLHGHVLVCGAMPDWTGDHLLTHLRQQFPQPRCHIQVENDANLAAVAEHRLGCARDTADVVHVLAGRRIGVGIVLNDTLRRGASGRAGEIANLPATPWARANSWLTKHDRDSAHELFHTAAARDSEAHGQVEDFAADLAAGLAELVYTIDPELIVIGGGLAHAGYTILNPTRKHLQNRCRRTPPPVELSTLGERAVLLGATCLALEHVQDTIFSTQPAETGHTSLGATHPPRPERPTMNATGTLWQKIKRPANHTTRADVGEMQHGSAENTAGSGLVPRVSNVPVVEPNQATTAS